MLHEVHEGLEDVVHDEHVRDVAYFSNVELIHEIATALHGDNALVPLLSIN